MLNNYLLASRDQMVVYKVLALKFFGKVSIVWGTRNKPEDMGLVDFGKRKSWKDEAVAIAAECERLGYHRYLKNVRAQKAKTLNKIKAAKRAYQFPVNRWKKKLALQRLQRNEALMHSLDEQIHKIEMVGDIFGRA